MTPKEKAKELLNKFNNSHDEENKRYIFYQNIDESKRCAIIAVDEILTALDEHQWQNRNVIEFYLCVKQDIINL